MVKPAANCLDVCGHIDWPSLHFPDDPQKQSVTDEAYVWFALASLWYKRRLGDYKKRIDPLYKGISYDHQDHLEKNLPKTGEEPVTRTWSMTCPIKIGR